MYNSEVAFSGFDPNNISDSIGANGFLHETNPNNSSTFTQIDPDNSHKIDEFQSPDLNNWTNTNNNNNNVSHEMMGYPNFDENNNNNINTTTSDILTLLHLPRCSFPPSSSTSFAPKSSSSSPPPPPELAAFIGEISNPNNMDINMIHDNASGGSCGLPYNPVWAATLPYDPLFHLNLPPQPSPLLRDLMFQSLPHGYTSNGVGPTRGDTGNCSIFGHMAVGEGSMNGMGGLYQENGGQMVNHGNRNNNSNNGIFEITRSVCMENDVKMGNKGPKHFVTEKQRRLNFNDKYDTLKKLIPTPTKMDRASIVFDAIKYINELKRTVGELKLLVEKKRISQERAKRLKTEDTNSPSDQNGRENVTGHGIEGTGYVKPDPDEVFAGSAATQLRSSWLQRKCKDTEVDVRIVDDEVTIKLVQRKKINCLLTVSRTLDDLRLDLRHVAGGHVGDYYSYLFNSKICEGSTVYASAIANKLIEVAERQYSAASVAVAPTTSF